MLFQEIRNVKGRGEPAVDGLIPHRGHRLIGMTLITEEEVASINGSWIAYHRAGKVSVAALILAPIK